MVCKKRWRHDVPGRPYDLAVSGVVTVVRGTIGRVLETVDAARAGRSQQEAGCSAPQTNVAQAGGAQTLIENSAAARQNVGQASWPVSGRLPTEGYGTRRVAGGLAPSSCSIDSYDRQVGPSRR